jgi:hypothetical protein
MKIRATGSWSPRPPPYLLAVSERDFVQQKEEWLKRVMMIGALVPSHRVLAYFVTDSLNWATMEGTDSEKCNEAVARASRVLPPPKRTAGGNRAPSR